MMLFIKGIIIGLSIALPVGPSALFCMQSSLIHGRIAGFLAALGIALGTACYTLVSFFGLSLICDQALRYKTYINIIGSIVLALFGLKIIFSKVSLNLTGKKAVGLINYFGIALFLTLINPLTLIYFLSVFPALGLSTLCKTSVDIICLVAAVFIAVLGWYSLIAVIIHSIRSRLSPTHIKTINYISGLIILCFSAYLLLGVIQ